MRWYKRDPDAALNGMAVLTLEERGAYNTVLDLIYSHDGNLHDDERTLARWIGCDIRVWRRVRRRLLDLGKLYVHGGNLHNGRADEELYAALQRLSGAATSAVLLREVRRKSKKTLEETMRKSSTPTTRIYTTSTYSKYRESKKAASRGNGDGTEQKLEPSPEFLEHERKRRPH
jgi:uncharacterized protein YdaU (DUF1376 family)